MIRAALVALLLALPGPAPAQDDVPRDFDAVMEALGGAIEAGDPDTAFVVLNRALRTARAEGRMTPDWAIFLAMAADHMRNARGNPAFALTLIDEGLALVAGLPEQEDFAAALRVSGAYALADLGRLDEAADQARLALPRFRAFFGDADADELASYVALWSEGRLSGFNTAATDLARQTLDRAWAAAETGAHGRALALAGAAILPPGGGLPAGEVRALNAEAEIAIATSLRALGRRQDAANALLRAINHLARTPWQPGTPADWWPEASDDAGPARLFNAFQMLAGLAVEADALDLARAALSAAESFARQPGETMTLLLYQAVLANRDADPEGALALIAASRDRALAAGDAASAAMADFYVAQVRSLAETRAGRTPDAAPLIAAGEAAMAAMAAMAPDDDALLAGLTGDLARHLSRSDDRAAALDYARRALTLGRQALARRSDSGFGQAQARAAQRGVLEVFLRTAHNAAAAADPGCEDAAPGAFDGCVIAAP